MSNEKRMGRVTIPTDLDAVPETLQLMERWGADALRDCDGTEFPKELKDAGAKVYATYYTTRKDNACGCHRSTIRCAVRCEVHQLISRPTPRCWMA